MINMTNTVKEIITLEYFYKYSINFLIIYLIIFFGSITSEIFSFKKDIKKKIYLRYSLLSSIVVTFIILAIYEYINLSFSILGLLCFLSGIWSINITTKILDSNNIPIFIKNIFREFSSPIMKGIANSIDEINKKNKTNSDNDK